MRTTFLLNCNGLYGESGHEVTHILVTDDLDLLEQYRLSGIELGKSFTEQQAKDWAPTLIEHEEFEILRGIQLVNDDRPIVSPIRKIGILNDPFTGTLTTDHGVFEFELIGEAPHSKGKENSKLYGRKDLTDSTTFSRYFVR